MLLATLGLSLLGNLLTGKGVNKKGSGTNRAGKGVNLELKKCLKEKVINYMSSGKVITIHLIVGLIKKMYYKSESVFF